MKTARQIERDAKDLWHLCRVDGTVDEERVRQVIDFLIASQRRGVPAVLSRLLRLAKLDADRHTARVASAAPLDDHTRAAIEAGLVRRYGPAITTVFEVDPHLIGGTRVAIGSDVYDGSVDGRLAAIGARF